MINALLLKTNSLTTARVSSVQGRTYSRMSSSSKFSAYNPKTGRSIDPEYEEATEVQVDQVVHQSERAFHDYKQRSGTEVAKFLKTISEEIIKSTKPIIERAMLETGYTDARLNTELQRTVNQLNMFSNLVEEGSFIEAKIIKQEGKPDLRRMLIPIGPVAVFGASNFPLAFSVAGGDTASALAAKCPVVVKAHPAHPGTSEIVANCIIRAQQSCNMPNNVFTMVQGGARPGTALAKHPLIKAIGFTGSLTGGRNLFNIASQRENPIPVYAEMGSVNPVVILPEALESKAKQTAEQLAQSVTGSSGQFCTKPGIIITVGDPSPFLQHFAKLLGDTPPAFLLTKSIKEGYERGTQSLEKYPGVTLLARGSTTENAVSACVFSTNASTFLQTPALHEEVFGPVTLVVTCSSVEEAESVAQSLEGQLTGTIHATSGDLASSKQLVDNLTERVGRLIFNGVPTGVDVSSPMVHGGPYPSTTSANYTSVGTDAIKRWLRPICYQNVPHELLPIELQNDNKKKIWRMVNDKMTQDALQ